MKLPRTKSDWKVIGEVAGMVTLLVVMFGLMIGWTLLKWAALWKFVTQ